MKYVLLYLFLVNAAGLLFMLADKHRARKKQWRIPEAALMGIAAMGGSIGALLGMYAFRHKTRHPKFYIGIPVLLVMQLCLAILLYQII